jgi:hypothetical protein
VSLTPGTTVDAELVFFPSAWPLRALVKERYGTSESQATKWPHKTIADANTFAADALIVNPWIERLPFAFESVTPARRSHGWIIRDEAGSALPLDITERNAWVLNSLSGGRPVSLAGEWDGAAFAPLSVQAEGRFLRL